MSLPIIDSVNSYGGNLLTPIFIWAIMSFLLFLLQIIVRWRTPSLLMKISGFRGVILVLCPAWAIHCFLILYTFIQLYAFRFFYGWQIHPLYGELVENTFVLTRTALALILFSSFWLLMVSFVLIKEKKGNEGNLK